MKDRTQRNEVEAKRDKTYTLLVTGKEDKDRESERDVG